jgi:hypothetical protein
MVMIWPMQPVLTRHNQNRTSAATPTSSTAPTSLPAPYIDADQLRAARVVQFIASRIANAQE